MWLIFPAGILPLLSGPGHSMARLADARDQFPQLVAYLLCLGMPVGVTLGIRGGLVKAPGKAKFHWGRGDCGWWIRGCVWRNDFRALVICRGFFPLIAGLSAPVSRMAIAALQFVAAMFIGSSFGLLFQRWGWEFCCLFCLDSG
jgi:hypothetical protein